MDKPQPWSFDDATSIIRELVVDDSLSFSFTLHIQDRLSERNLIMSDVLFALKNGFVRTAPWESTVRGLFKYSMESRTPNSANRSIRVVVIPDLIGCQMKLVSVMWVDENETQAGTIVGEVE